MDCLCLGSKECSGCLAARVIVEVHLLLAARRPRVPKGDCGWLGGSELTPMPFVPAGVVCRGTGGGGGHSPCCPFGPQLPNNFLSHALKEFKLPFISAFAVKRL